MLQLHDKLQVELQLAAHRFHGPAAACEELDFRICGGLPQLKNVCLYGNFFDPRGMYSNVVSHLHRLYLMMMMS